MDKDHKQTIINIGPQDEMSWIAIAIAIVCASFFAFAVPAMEKEKSQRLKLTHEAPAK